jgi:hypothetical protein
MWSYVPQIDLFSNGRTKGDRGDLASVDDGLAAKVCDFVIGLRVGIAFMQQFGRRRTAHCRLNFR